MAAMLLAGAAIAPAFALTVPPAPPRFVHDGPGLLDGAGKRALEDRLMALNRERGLQIGVVILNSLEGQPLVETSMEIAEAWQPGFAGRDDGLLISIFLKERKLRIDVGHGLEGAIPDVIAGRVIREQISPAFRSRNYAQGLIDAVNTLAAAAKGETLPPPPEQASGRRKGPRTAAVIAQIVFILIFLVIARAGRKRRGLSGKGSNLPFWLWLLYSLGRGGGGGGSFGGGGGSFGGGSFGGGSFGGGGASGGW